MIVYDNSRSVSNGDDVVEVFHAEFSDEGLKIEVSPELFDAVKPFSLLSEDSFFSDETTDKLVDIVDSILYPLGYEIRYGRNYHYTINSRDKVNRSLILDSSEVLLPDNSYENLTELTPEELEMGFLCFATVKDGKIVSIATENPHHEEAKRIDIGVETTPEYEGNGYGSSNVASLSYYLLDSGITVTYTVDDGNIPSIRLAEKVGFTRQYHWFDTVGVKIETSENKE
jgi:hypothetical protein